MPAQKNYLRDRLWIGDGGVYWHPEKFGELFVLPEIFQQNTATKKEF